TPTPAPVFVRPPSVASCVWGQGLSFTTNAVNKGGLSADSLNLPSYAIRDPLGGVYIADSQNNRVLHYPAGSTTADRVYGQGGSFTSDDRNHGGVSASSLQRPVGVVADPAGGLYVADYGNSRVLHFPGASTVADRVYGQGGSFTSGGSNSGGVSANSLAF